MALDVRRRLASVGGCHAAGPARAHRRARRAEATRQERVARSRIGDLLSKLAAEGLVLVRMVSPVTPAERLAALCRDARGFVYAVSATGTTGRSLALAPALLEYLDAVRHLSDVPVCAGFGIRARAQLDALRGHVDGVVVGSALVEVLERGEDPVAFLHSLRG